MFLYVLEVYRSFTSTLRETAEEEQGTGSALILTQPLLVVKEPESPGVGIAGTWRVGGLKIDTTKKPVNTPASKQGIKSIILYLRVSSV